MYERYAIYFTPPAQSHLARFGRAWFGAHASAVPSHTPRETLGLDAARVAQLTRDAARYALHATLMAPFRLAAGFDEADLARAVRQLAHGQAPLEVGPLAVTELRGFLALVATGETEALDRLAASVVGSLDKYRAPTTADERTRWEHKDLTDRERTNLECRGYPYVADAFQFHMTLTGEFGDAAEREAFCQALSHRLAPSTQSPLRVEDICLFGDPGEARPFQLLDRFKLKG